MRSRPPRQASDAILRVAIDARMAAHSGIGTYIRELVRALADLDPPVTAIALGPGEGLSAPIYGLREQLQVLRAFARLRPPPDLLHVPHYNAPLLFRGTLVVTVHDLIHLRLPRLARRAGASLYARAMIPRVCARARVVICPSEATRRDLLDLAPDAAPRIRVIPQGCALRPPEPAAREAALARLRVPSRYILYVGNIRPHKNLDVLFRALDELPAPCRLPVVLAGEDQMPGAWPPRERPGTRFLGPVREDDLPPLYSGAEVFVFPSLYEGFGLPPLEAMACGAPVICSSAGALPEVVGDAALTFDPLDAGSLARALRAVLEAPDLREKLRRAGFERARRFAWDRTARATAAAYREALASPKRAGQR